MTGDALTHRAEERTSDERWASWIAKGADHDRRMTARIVVIAAAVAALVAAAILVAR
jgi:hypothetical protein